MKISRHNYNVQLTNRASSKIPTNNIIVIFVMCYRSEPRIATRASNYEYGSIFHYD
jgi:hypothetical protein